MATSFLVGAGGLPAGFTEGLIVEDGHLSAWQNYHDGRICLCGFEEPHLKDPLLSKPLGKSIMTSLAAITIVLTIMGSVKMVVTGGPVDLYGSCQVRDSSDDRGDILDLVKIVSRMIGALLQAWQAGAVTQGDFIIGGVLWAPSLDFRGENLMYDLH
jgi:hypothetical protein